MSESLHRMTVSGRVYLQPGIALAVFLVATFAFRELHGIDLAQESSSEDGHVAMESPDDVLCVDEHRIVNFSFACSGGACGDPEGLGQMANELEKVLLQPSWLEVTDLDMQGSLGQHTVFLGRTEQDRRRAKVMFGFSRAWHYLVEGVGSKQADALLKKALEAV